MPAVSVVMAVKNGEATLSRAIDSILAQSFKDFEFLIADDFSTDDTPKILNSIKDERVIIQRANKPGLVNALNHCLKKSRGKYIARMDADDYAYPTRLERQVQLLEAEPEIGVVAGMVKHISTEESQEGYALHVQQINKISTAEEHFANRFKDAPLANPSSMLRTTLLDNFGYYKEFDGPEDYEFWLRLLHEGVQFKKLEHYVLDWYDYSYRLTRNDSNYNNEAFFKLKAEYFSKWWERKAIPDKEIWVWGYGKDAFSKSSWIEKFGVNIEGYIDLKKRVSSRNTIHYNQINKDKMFILVYVSDREGQKRIKEYLAENNFQPTQDYYFMT